MATINRQQTIERDTELSILLKKIQYTGFKDLTLEDEDTLIHSLIVQMENPVVNEEFCDSERQPLFNDNCY
tara:strand:- start:284 stop:496 length:213 start_codon:yes stop_codon:yes gene_type:complete